MAPPPPPPIDLAMAVALLRKARRVLDTLEALHVPVPRDVAHALQTFYDLTDYHGIAPDDAPHIPDDGQI